MPDNYTPPPSQIIGGNMFCTALVQGLMYTLAGMDIIPPKALEAMLDEMLLQCEKLAAAPSNLAPGATVYAHERMTEFLRKFRKDTSTPE